ncbi:MAG: S1C family serine protease [Acidimicrobiia bacterium]
MEATTRWRSATAVILAAALSVAGACGGDDGGGEEPSGDQGSATREAGTGGGGGQDTGTFENIPDVVDAVSPSVVAISTGPGEGSGVIIQSDGVIVTNAHVVGDADAVEVTFADASRAEAEVVGADRLTDLAVLRVDRDLPAVELAEELPEVGELAVAIGNPFGFENTVTAGIISGLERAIPGAAQQAPGLVDLIQTDAPISPGNSGGALVNTDGQLVGVNVAYIPPAGGAVSIGFAIPAATVASVVEDLLEDGEASHPFLGVRPQAITPTLAEQYDLAREEGVLVLSATPGGPAAEAGVGAGDIIVELEGEPVRTVEDLLGAIRGMEPGDELQMTVVSDGEEREVTVTLGERPGGA